MVPSYLSSTPGNPRLKPADLRITEDKPKRENKAIIRPQFFSVGDS